MARRTRITIDELAQAVGISTRNVRYYQTRGLLPPPTVEGRTGYYDARHVDRLKLIAEVKREGLNLTAIEWLLGGAGQIDSDELRRLKRAVLDDWVTDKPLEVGAQDVLQGLGVEDLDDPSVARAVELGLLAATDDPQRWSVLLPGVLAAGAQMAELGAGADGALDVLAQMREHASAIADAYVTLFDEAVLAPWDARGRPDDEWPAIRGAVERMRPLAGQALMSVFSAAMAQAVARRVDRAMAED